jgi:arsenite-transporting ATPase
MKFLERPTRHLFFTGKGGVGKTSLACATAVELADAGRKVLLVSTDPASNLDEVLGVGLGSAPTKIPGLETLWALNIDPGSAAAAYRERMVGPYRGRLPEVAIQSMEEQFSGSCTLEIAAFDEFARLLGDPSATQSFEHVIFDTAPTGHTLRLLTLPSAWSGFMEQNTTGTSCLGPLAGLQAQQSLYRGVVKTLGDPDQTTVVLVSRGESSALREAARTSTELNELGIANQRLIVNGVFKALDRSDPYAVAWEQRGLAAISDMPLGLRTLPLTLVPLSPTNVLGLSSLRALGLPPATVLASSPSHLSPADRAWPSLTGWMDDLTSRGHGIILVMGKGGVGKTSIAAAVAVGIAQRGFPVRLSTTDPAAHLDSTLNSESLPTLSLDRIDPAAVTAQYRDEIMARAGGNLDARGKALLDEDLRSPCTEEIAIFRAFANAVSDAEQQFVVMDTAPTGHTVLLLDAALAHHREMSRQTQALPPSVRQLLPRLRDPGHTKVLIVTLPEATPVHEAAGLQAELRRAGIEPFGWVINQSLCPLNLSDPVLRHRRACEQPYMDEVLDRLATRVAVVPWQLEPPQGIDRLLRLLGGSSPVESESLG